MRSETLFDTAHRDGAVLTVCIPLYNGEAFIREALDSLLSQTLPLFNLFIVDDASSDGSVMTVLDWLAANHGRFGRACLQVCGQNRGPSAARTQAISACATPYVFLLDADNLLLPRCLERHLEVLDGKGADVVYALIRCFGLEEKIMGNCSWSRESLKRGNRIDNMSALRVSAWEKVGAYPQMPAHGWEDYHLWCRMLEAGCKGVHIPEILSCYRRREGSLISLTNQSKTIRVLHAFMQDRHPWLELGQV